MGTAIREGRRIELRGTVQGVGMRPWIYRIAFERGVTGRVWLAGESSDKWHSSWGGGIWIGLLARSNAVAVSWAKSDERTAFYVRAGFSF